MDFAFSSIQKGALRKHYMLPMAFWQRGGAVHVHTRMCFGLGRQRFAVESTGSFMCACSLALCRVPAGTHPPCATKFLIARRVPAYLCSSRLDLLCFFLFFRYESPNIALRCGIMLRECIRHEPLAKIILFSEQFRDFFKYVEMSTFDIASDAFATFKVNYSMPAS